MRCAARTLDPCGGEKSPFGDELGFYTLFLVFTAGCIAGVAVETLWQLALEGRIESRASLVYGPFNVVYGFGAVVLTAALRSLRERSDEWIFACCMLIGGAFEYLCSVWQERTTGTVSWDYGGTPFNFQGRTNLSFMLLWGLLGLIWIRRALPALYAFAVKIPARIAVPLTWALVLFFAFNMLTSSLALRRRIERGLGVPPRTRIDRILDERFPDERLERIYPNMRPAKTGEVGAE